MICRNCSAVIPQDSEICPNCNKYPGRKPEKKKPSALVIVLIVILLGFAVYGFYNIVKGNPLISVNQTTKADITTNKDETTSFSNEEETSQEFDVSQSFTDSQNDETDVDFENDSETTSDSSTSDNPLFSSPISTQYVFEYDEIRTCNRAFINLDKNALKSVTQEQFKDYIFARIYKVNYCWFTIDCGDKTGIVFQSGNFSLISYGEIDELGRIEKLLGYILLKKDGTYVYKSADEITPDFVSEQNTTVSQTTETQIAQESQTVVTDETTSSTQSQPSVFVTQSGKKYHKADCYYLSSAATKMTKEEAIENGYEPCSKCNP